MSYMVMFVCSGLNRSVRQAASLSIWVGTASGEPHQFHWAVNYLLSPYLLEGNLQSTYLIIIGIHLTCTSFLNLAIDKCKLNTKVGTDIEMNPAGPKE
jgi:hypothetical protein